MNPFDEKREDEFSRLVQKGFFIEKATRPIFLDTVPRDGFEYIYKCRLEDEKVDYNLSENLTEVLHRPYTPTSVMRLWGRKEAQNFTYLAIKLKDNKEMLRNKFSKVIETPELDDKEWCTFCLGSKKCSEIYRDDSQEQVKEGHLPLLSIVVHLSQKQIMNLISYCYKWFQMVGMDDDMGRWIYALFGNVEKPVNDKYQQELEAFHDYCKKILGTLDDSDKDRVYLILSILKQYFCVKYYTSGPPLSTFFKMSNSSSSE